MIVVVQSIGQVGNRLQQFSHLIAFSRDHNVAIANPAFSLYAEFFEQTRQDLLCRYPSKSASWVTKKLQRLCYYLLRLCAQFRLLNLVPNSVWVDLHWTAEVYDLGNPYFIEFAKNRKFVFLTGTWVHQYWKSYEASLGEIGTFLTLAEPWSSEVRRVADELSGKGNVSVGVHIRQGDFKEHFGGKHYFTTAQYALVMRRVCQLLGGKVAFLICSNQAQDLSAFAGLEYLIGPGHFITDMYALAECDYIIGPGVSSFSAWASLIGQKPRYGVFDPGKEFSLEDFVVCKGLR